MFPEVNQMHEKKISIALLAVLLAASSVSAATYDDFKGVSAAAMKPFARDLGGLLGSGAAQTARPLGFSGFDIGVRGMAQFNPSHGDAVLKKNNLFGLGLVQAEIGMPYRVDGFVRGGSYEGLSVAGGGLRYGLWNVSDEKYKINAMIVGLADVATSQYFYAIHFHTSVICSLNAPVVSPYISVGYDSTHLKAQGVADSSLDGASVHVAEPRFAAGLRTKINLGYLTASVAYTHDRPVVGASTGFRF